MRKFSILILFILFPQILFSSDENKQTLPNITTLLNFTNNNNAKNYQKKLVNKIKTTLAEISDTDLAKLGKVIPPNQAS